MNDGNADEVMRLNKIESKLDELSATAQRLDKTTNETAKVVRRTAIILSRLAGDFSDFKGWAHENLATKTEVRDLRGAVDGFAGQMRDFRLLWSLHDDRLSRLEDKPH